MYGCGSRLISWNWETTLSGRGPYSPAAVERPSLAVAWCPVRTIGRLTESPGYSSDCDRRWQALNRLLGSRGGFEGWPEGEGLILPRRRTLPSLETLDSPFEERRGEEEDGRRRIETLCWRRTWICFWNKTELCIFAYRYLLNTNNFIVQETPGDIWGDWGPYNRTEVPIRALLYSSTIKV